MSKADELYADGRDVWLDPVGHGAVDPNAVEYKSVFAGHMYHFTSLVNKQVFDENPELWVSTPHASEISSHLSAIGEPE